MSVTYQTPEEHIKVLLGRALNSFELPDETIGSLESALAYDSSLHSSHHSSGLHCEIHRHAFLLGDGSAVTLWELAHNTAAHGLPQYELYVTEDEARTAASRLPLQTELPDFTSRGPDVEQLPPEVQRLVAEYAALPERSYASEESADHARRLLRRAENADRPDRATAQLLGMAFAHEIRQVFRSPSRDDATGIGFALYEHAFLLQDGREISLWEAEHTATPDGRHMCEVYLSEEAARAAMERRASQPR